MSRILQGYISNMCEQPILLKVEGVVEFNGFYSDLGRNRDFGRFRKKELDFWGLGGFWRRLIGKGAEYTYRKMGH